MTTIDQLHRQSLALDAGKTDTLQLTHHLQYDHHCHLNFGGEDGLPLTNHALRQVCKRLKTPYKYLTRCPELLRATNLNYWQNQLPDGGQWLIRMADNTVRAVLSEHYTVVDNSTILSLLDKLLEGVHVKLIRPYLDGNSLHLRLATNDSQGGHYQIGCYVSNDEVGSGAIIVAPFIQRTSCTNSIIHVEGGIRRAHYRLDTAFVRALLKHEVGRALQLSAEMLDAVIEAETERLPDIAGIVADLADRKGLTKATQDNILIGTESARTRMGLVNGLSYAAHATPELPIGARVMLEILAGRVLTAQASVADLWSPSVAEVGDDEPTYVERQMDNRMPAFSQNGHRDRSRRIDTSFEAFSGTPQPHLELFG
jgi:hypothetical protein